MSNGIPWALDELETLRAMADSGMSTPSIARLLERSVPSVKAKLASERGKPYRQTRRPSAEPHDGPEAEAPRPRSNDHEKHLRLLLAALQRQRAA